MATGPQLVGIQPNEGELLSQGQVRTTAPLELSLLFNSAASIDPTSLPTDESSPAWYDSIQITRSGLDGTFERASVFSDFNTLGAVQIALTAKAAGHAGSLISLEVSKANLGDDRKPTIEVDGNVIQVTLNSKVGKETRATDLIAAINGDTEASSLVTATLRSGSSTTNLATPTINYSPLAMNPANSAIATSSFNVSGLQIQFVATQPGMESNGTMIQVTKANLGNSVAPTITVNDKTISITLNSNATTPTTAAQLVNAVNAHAGASALVKAHIRSGDPTAAVGSRGINYSPLVMTGANDVRVEPGYLDLGDSLREVVVRFKDHLPDDVYMIEILGGGSAPLQNVNGDAFNDGGSFQMTFELDLGAQIISVVPQPITRDASGDLDQQRNVIEVYFNDDDLDPVTAQDPRYYQLIHVSETANTADDQVFHPVAVQYNAQTDRAILTFASPLEQLAGAGTYRLRIGTDESQPLVPVTVSISQDPGSSFDTALDLTGQDLGSRGVLLTTEILSGLYPLDYPGGDDEPGHRDIPWIEDHLEKGLRNDEVEGDSTAGITTYYYNFQDEYGFDPDGHVLHNAITEIEKQRTREIFDLYARYLGVNFIETANRGFTIVTGDLRAVDPSVPTGVGGVLGIAGGGMAVMDLQDFQNPGDDEFGGPWFQTAMHEIGHLLGMYHSYDLPPLTIQGDEPDLSFGQVPEGVFPGDADIAHGQFLFRPESNDIDLYKFELDEAGLFSVETSAERLNDPSLLDTVLTLYKQNANGTRELISRNDDYYNSDSYIEMHLEAGTYYVGVSASGNLDYDAEVADTGAGGRSQGNYQLRLNFRPAVNDAILDTTGKQLDGDADGEAGGVYNFWFRAAAPSLGGSSSQPRTIFVDKAAANASKVETGNGSLDRPFGYIPSALSVAKPNDIIRLVGNGGADGDITTLGDNVAYQIGFSKVGGQALQDGSTLEVPRGVTLVIDANAVLKLRRARISVGSSAQTVDRSAGALQVLGTPRILDATGQVIVDETGQAIEGSVYFTSLHDTEVGKDFNPDQAPPAALPGDWGGIVFRSDLDIADSNRLVYGQEGIFINYVNHAVMTYGGGEVMINGISQIVAPLQMIDERPTLTFNTIMQSANWAMSANPDSFEEDNFHAPKFQAVPFTSDYDRVGPEIHHNTLIQNSMNGLFIRITTLAGQDLEELTKSARWDDTDITHIVSENLVLQGSPGGPILEDVAPPVNLITLAAAAGGTLDPGPYEYKLVYVDDDGSEGPPSDATRIVDVTAGTGAVVLRNLPQLKPTDPFVARRIYRAEAGSGRYELVAQINAEDTTFIDFGSLIGGELEEYVDSVRTRLSGRLAVDPGTIVKLDRSRIEATFGAQFISEGIDGKPIVYTSLSDDRYGSGGTFDTNLQGGQSSAAAGDWGGIYLGHVSRGSIDFSIFAFGGGTTRIEGTFAGFNVLEIHQAEVRVANSIFESNSDGQGGQSPASRYGYSENDDAVIFVRGAQPIIVANTLVNNSAPAISVNANALNSLAQNDSGRTTGAVHIVSGVNDNQGPLVRQNMLDGNAVNGMVVRGATLTTQGVWDDTDIVHVVYDTIYVPDFHTYGGLRLESNPQESLVVKLSGATAGFTATGQDLEITDRIGGALQIVGQPRFPVVLTSLSDDTVGAGFTPDGMPQTDTNGDGSSGSRLPTGPEVNNDTLIDNDVAAGIPGQFAFDVFDGGASDFFSRGGISAQGDTSQFIDENVIFDFTNYVDVGSNGTALNLRYTNITMPATLIADDLVVSEGNFEGENGTIFWHAESRMDDGISIVYNTITFTSTAALGDIQFINYLDEDIRFVSDDLLYLTGTPGTNDFRAFTLDGEERVGFSQGGFVEPGADLVNASYVGWAADQYFDLQLAIEGFGTTYTVPGNIDTADLVPFNDPELGPVYGLEDVTTAFAWAVDPAATTSKITTFLELVPRNPASAGQAGDWRSIRLDEWSNDRNVDVATEREPSDSTTGPDNNQNPDNAQYVGALAPNEKSGDDTLRLGFEVHGVISQKDDVDVYSFQAKAGTEVWFDIDRTSQSLDTVVELVDADGNIIALSNDSYDEELGQQTIYTNPSKIAANMVSSLRKSASDFYPDSAVGEPKDLYSTNLRDAGMRIVLPGSQGTTNTYYVRVRSSSVQPGDVVDGLLDPSRLNSGLTSGIYQLQIRLSETDEVPGSTVQYADIRYATNGIEIFGQPTHSPLTGESAEDDTPNDTIFTAQPIGNVVSSDRGALGVAGELVGLTDVDFYQFEIAFESIQNISGFTNSVQHLATVLDIDYADGLARANTSITVFDASGNVVLYAADSNIADDQPAALNGTDMDDLSRGSAGVLDPYVGSQELLAGTYYVAISSDAQVPAEFEQFYSPTPANSLFRLEPVTSVKRIVEDHISSSYYATTEAPQIPVLFDDDSAVPYSLGDIVFFVSGDIGGDNNNRLYTVDPFTGTVETIVRRDAENIDLTRNIEDIAMKPDGTLHAFSVDENYPFTAGESGNYLLIDTGNGTITQVGDDGIDLYQVNDNGDGDEATPAELQGYQFLAMTYGDPNIYNSGGPTYLFAVGNRIPGRGNDYTENVLYRFDADTGTAVSLFQNRDGCGNPGGCRFPNAGTQIVERGYLDTSPDPLAADTQLLLVEATEVNSVTGATTSLILDGTLFSVDHDGNPLTDALFFEFNTGPEIYLHPNPATGAFVRDGDFFEIDGDTFEFDTGSVIVMNATSGSQIADGARITITDNQLTPVTRTFEFDKNNSVTPGNIRIAINNGMSTSALMTQTVNAINSVAGFDVTAEVLAGNNRITLRGESEFTGATSTSAFVAIQGTPGGSGDYVIQIEESSDLDEYGNALVDTFLTVPGVTLGWDGQRVNFSGAGSGLFNQMVLRNVFTDVGSNGSTTAGLSIPFLAQDTAQELATRVKDQLDLFLAGGNTAAVSDRTVVLSGGAKFESADSPLRIAGAAPGGLITGIAFVNNTMYAVTDTGGLFRVTNPGGRNAEAVYIATSAQDLQGINFQSLTAGPTATENGRYANTLFAMDGDGTLYAFDPAGRLQPMFVDGQTSVETGLTAVNGIAFSTLQENPWSIVDGIRARSQDAGHGLETTFDLTRFEPVYPSYGNASLHFGRTRDNNLTPITYDWPGGASGTMESNKFSLVGYSAADKPVLYFSYFIDTERESSDPATQTPMLDSLRVYIGDSSGQWDLLATNNSYTLDELFDFPANPANPNQVQEIYDNGTGWRQVRVELGNYAGLDNLQLRVDFSTAGDMNVGDSTTVGSDLRILPGAKLSDGQTFYVDGVEFEVDLGYTLITPSGGAIQDGQTLRVYDGGFRDITFEFDSTGSLVDPSRVAVAFSPAMTPDELAMALQQAMLGEFLPAFRVLLDGNRINIPDAMEVEVSGSLQLAGAPGTVGLPVLVDAGMLDTQVRDVVQQALADRFANGVTEAFKVRDDVVRIIGHDVTDSGPFGLTNSLPFDSSGDFFSNLRGQDNRYEGVYLDDFIIGFAEHGEMGINGNGNTAFVANPESLPNQILTGAYQLEIRQGEKYGESQQGPDRLELVRSFDTNGRLTQSFSLVAPAGNEISDGQTFTLSDGVHSLTFEFDDLTLNNGVTPGNVEINYNPLVFDFATSDFRPQSSSEIAALIRNAINSTAAQAVIEITAALGDGAIASTLSTTSSVVNLFGNVDADVIGASVRITSTTTDANLLRDAILGDVFTPVGDATFSGSAVSAGLFDGGSSSIGIASGIILTTGDAHFAEGPNSDDGSTGSASGMGDPDLDTYFAPLVTEDSSVLEFSFQVDSASDLYFEFVFASEEYNEFVDSVFNDVFAFFVDGENIGFVPGTFDPVTINTVNGGNPYGTGGVNAESYNNNDRNDAGSFLESFGYDGFTDVFVARIDDLSVGVHTIKLAISDVGDTALDSAVFIRAFNAAGPDPRTSLPGITYNDKGDSNLERDQGQVIIHSNTISNSAGYGIVIDAYPRDGEGDSHPGAVRVTQKVNDLNLVPGVVVTNNLIVRNTTGGVLFSGDENLGTVADAPVPFGRLINNTIYGGGVGIRVENNASPTLLNNIVADASVGISIDFSSSSTVVGGTLYAGPGVASANGNVGDFPLFVASSDELFINKDLNNFYLAPHAKAIDSSVDSVQDRTAMVTIRQPLGIASSPILAPNVDLYGQARVDDPSVASPSGLGGNVFKDRGAIDRSDFAGPSASLILPRDNDAVGVDEDPRGTFVAVREQTLFGFSIQLIDGIAPSDQSNGSGPDRNTVNARAITVLKDGDPLEEGVDYLFGYDATSGIIRLTPLAGIWEPDYTYEVQLLNIDTLVITAPGGQSIIDGTTFTISDDEGTSVVFEFDSGYGLGVPATGGAGLVDGSTFTIKQGTTTKTFEFDSNNVSRPSSVKVAFNAADSADQVAASLAAAIRGAGLGLNASSWRNGFVHVGGDENTTINTGVTPLTLSGLPGVANDNEPVLYVAHVDFTDQDVAARIADAISASALQLTAEARLGDVVLVGARDVIGLVTTPVSAIRDLAGNILKANRNDGSTAFTISLGAGRDWGDAPSQYPTLKEDNGASHEIVDGFHLGSTIFATSDGEPSTAANLDIGDDGLVLTSLTAGYANTIGVIATGITAEQPGYLDAWIDFNNDGDWNDAGEKIFSSYTLTEGFNTLTLAGANRIPVDAVGTRYARFRLSSSGGLSSTGAASDGEVEDYLLTINGNPWHNYNNPNSTNGDAVASPIDVLLIIHLLNNPSSNYINNIIGDPGFGRLWNPPLPGFEPPPYYDVNGDGFVSPIDALLVIDYLNRGSGEGEAEGEAWDGGLLAADSSDTAGRVALDTGLLGGSWLASAATVASPDAGAAVKSTVRTTASSASTLLIGAATAQVRGEILGSDFRSQDLEDLLKDLADERDEVLVASDPHDEFFAGYEVG